MNKRYLIEVVILIALVIFALVTQFWSWEGAHLTLFAMVLTAVATGIMAGLNHRLIEKSTEHEKSRLIVGLLDRYTGVTERYFSALDDTKHTKTRECYAEEYCQEVFDLMWVEVQLYINRMLPRNLFVSWCWFRNKQWDSREGLAGTKVVYRDIWNKKREDYFNTRGEDNPDSVFATFMDRIHAAKGQKDIDDALQELEKKENLKW